MIEKLTELLRAMKANPEITCPRYSTKESCNGCEFSKGNNCDVTSRQANYLISNGVIVPPCKVGDKVYYNKAEIPETCPAKIIKITNNYYTPSMPLWITIVYKSKLIGRQEEEMASDVFKLLCHYNKEEAEQTLKDGVQE